MTRLITMGLIISVTVIMIAWDIFVAIEPTPGDTVSKVVLKLLYDHGALAFIFGVAVGHLAWPMEHMQGYWLFSVPILVVLGITVIILDIFSLIPSINPIAWVLVGAIAGHFLWPQDPILMDCSPN